MLQFHPDARTTCYLVIYKLGGVYIVIKSRFLRPIAMGLGMRHASARDAPQTAAQTLSPSTLRDVANLKVSNLGWD